LLGILRSPEEKAKDDRRPSALKKVSKTTIPPDLVAAVAWRANAWLQQNYKIEIGGSWQHYYMYTLERYWSFRELAEGERSDHPGWYHDGAELLVSTQKADGWWDGREGPSVATAFSIMFLLRATQRSIGRNIENLALEGTLIGGRGLPKDTRSVTVREGQVVASRSRLSLAMLMGAVGQSDDESFEAMEGLVALPVAEAQTLVSKHAQRIRSLAKDGSPEARLAAVRALAKAVSFDDVPTHINALNDPDSDIVCEARDGMRRISRKFDGFGMPDKPNVTELRQAIDKWKDWYLAVRPDAEFDDWPSEPVVTKER
jgi:hypothetical protein